MRCAFYVPLKTLLFCILLLLLSGVLYVKGRQRVATRELRLALARDDYQAVRKWAAQAGDVNVWPLRNRKPDEFEFIYEDGTPVGEINTPLLMAVKHDDMDTIRLLLKKGANVNQADGNDWSRLSPLIIAIQRSNSHAVKILLDHGATPNTCEAHGWTALEIAERRAKSQFARTNIESPFPNPTKADAALKARRKLIVSMLKQAGAISPQHR